MQQSAKSVGVVFVAVEVGHQGAGIAERLVTKNAEPCGIRLMGDDADGIADQCRDDDGGSVRTPVRNPEGSPCLPGDAVCGQVREGDGQDSLRGAG